MITFWIPSSCVIDGVEDFIMRLLSPEIVPESWKTWARRYKSLYLATRVRDGEPPTSLGESAKNARTVRDIIVQFPSKSGTYFLNLVFEEEEIILSQQSIPHRGRMERNLDVDSDPKPRLRKPSKKKSRTEDVQIKKEEHIKEEPLDIKQEPLDDTDWEDVPNLKQEPRDKPRKSAHKRGPSQISSTGSDEYEGIPDEWKEEWKHQNEKPDATEEAQLCTGEAESGAEAEATESDVQSTLTEPIQSKDTKATKATTTSSLRGRTKKPSGRKMKADAGEV
jgi:hypothetical protein